MTKKIAIPLIVISTLLIATIMIAISYAYWTITTVQVTTNTIATGCFNVIISEEKNAINLENAYPITDEEGMQSTPFTFTIKNTCDINSVYTVNLEALAGSDLNTNFIATKINNKDIKTLGSLTSATPAESDSIESRVIATGSLAPSKSVTYDLRLWMDESVTLDDDAQNKLFNGKIVVVAEAAPRTPKCIRATTLHTDICNYTDSKGCAKAGYTNGDIITYGNENVSSGSLNAGDAFTCDVNGDGTYDEATERFYYVSDYYNTTNKEFESDTAVLIYYSNVLNGLRSGGWAPYDSSGENWHGPRTAMEHLPTTEQWSNVTLKNTERQILSSDGNTTTAGGTLPNAFSYTGKAARLLTYFEMSSLCGTNPYAKCQFFGENAGFATDAYYSYGFWIENPLVQEGIDKVPVISGVDADILIPDESYSNISVRPVIEVAKADINY